MQAVGKLIFVSGAASGIGRAAARRWAQAGGSVAAADVNEEGLAETARGLAGIRLGRVSDVPENDRPFGMEAEEIAQGWCARTGIAWLGRADIGHDAANKVVPFGLHRAG